MLLTVRLSLEDSLRADAWAMKSLRDYANGRLIMHAWVSRGLVSVEQLAEWKFGGSIDDLREGMKRTIDGMRNLLRMDSIAEGSATGEDPERKALVEAAESVILPGEKKIVWAICDPGATESPPATLPLPEWFKNPITRTIANWQKEAHMWQTKISNRYERYQKELPPKQKADYEKWSAATTRRLVLNKQRKAQVMNVQSSNLKQIKSNCILLEIKMSHVAEELLIRSGEGDWFRLVMLEGVAPATDVPAALDIEPGPYLT